jgi:hypothetical protein
LRYGIHHLRFPTKEIRMHNATKRGANFLSFPAVLMLTCRQSLRLCPRAVSLSLSLSLSLRDSVLCLPTDSYSFLINNYFSPPPPPPLSMSTGRVAPRVGVWLPIFVYVLSFAPVVL